METFSALLAICAENSPVPDEFPAQRPVTRSFDVFFDLCLNKRLSKQSWGWWFETPSRPLWRHRNDDHRYRHRYHDDNGEEEHIILFLFHIIDNINIISVWSLFISVIILVFVLSSLGVQLLAFCQHYSDVITSSFITIVTIIECGEPLAEKGWYMPNN